MQLSRFLTCSFRVETEFYYYTLLHYVQKLAASRDAY